MYTYINTLSCGESQVLLSFLRVCVSETEKILNDAGMRRGPAFPVGFLHTEGIARRHTHTHMLLASDDEHNLFLHMH